jgi:hypothetical protein
MFIKQPDNDDEDEEAFHTLSSDDEGHLSSPPKQGTLNVI